MLNQQTPSLSHSRMPSYFELHMQDENELDKTTYQRMKDMQKADPEYFLFKMILSALQKSKDANVTESNPKRTGIKRGSVQPGHHLGKLTDLYQARKPKGRKKEAFDTKPIGEINKAD